MLEQLVRWWLGFSGPLSLNGSGQQTGPFAGITLDTAGNLLGTTHPEGRNGVGSVFKLTRSGGSWVFSDLHDFDEADGA